MNSKREVKGRTSDVDALVDDELAVPQVVEDGLEVLRAAVDEEGAALVPRVAPHVWSDDNGATWWSSLATFSMTTNTQQQSVALAREIYKRSRYLK